MQGRVGETGCTSLSRPCVPHFQVLVAVSRILGRSFEGRGPFALLGGSAYIVWAYRCGGDGDSKRTPEPQDIGSARCLSGAPVLHCHASTHLNSNPHSRLPSSQPTMGHLPSPPYPHPPYRALGCSIGRNVCLYPHGADPMVRGQAAGVLWGAWPPPPKDCAPLTCGCGGMPGLATLLRNCGGAVTARSTAGAQAGASSRLAHSLPCPGCLLLQMTEPDLVTLGDGACVDNAALIAHVNPRGRCVRSDLGAWSLCQHMSTHAEKADIHATICSTHAHTRAHAQV